MTGGFPRGRAALAVWLLTAIVPSFAAAEEPPEAPIPEVTVEARSLSGFWKVTGPLYVDLDSGIFSGIRINYSGDVAERDICRIEDRGGRLTALCSAGTTRLGHGDVDDDRVALRWWDGPVTMIFHGTVKGGLTVPGALSGGVLGLGMTGGIPVTLTRINPDETGAAEPPSATTMRAVLADLKSGALTLGRYGPEALAHLPSARSHLPDDPQRVTFLGSIRIRWRKRQAEKVQDVYRVEAPTGEALCRIASGEGGVVTDFDCRSI